MGPRLRHIAVQAEERRLKKEIRVREEKVVLDIIKSAHVVCTTNVGAASKMIQKVFGVQKRKGTATAGSFHPLYL
jgi:hypothetical protein